MYREINDPRVPWTDEQKLSIGLSGGNVLVSASAGSGKTAVLTERLLQRIIDRDDPADIREFVVVTFTKAAAAEMKARLGKKLNDFLREHPERSGVKCQLMHVTEANISTIDSFCLSLLEKYQSSPDSGYVPGVKIASEGEAKLLFKKAVNDALEEEFGKGEAGFYALIDAMSDRSGGTGSVKAAVERLHFILDISPERDRVKEKMTKAFSGGGIDTASLFAAVFENTAAAAAYHEKRLNGLIANAHSPEEDAKLAAHIEYIKKCAELARSIRSAAEARDYAGCGELLEVVGGKPRKPDNTPFAWYTARADVLGAFEGFIKNAAKEFSYTEEALEAEFAELGAIAERLFALTENAEARYADMKKDRGLWDYSDLETRALKLLWKRGEDGKLHRTSVSLEEGARYREILIDEYQDVNGVQDLIFRGICPESGNNVFMVGDVKQSIYGFRGATPKLFIDKRNEYHAATPEDAEFPAKIPLNANFRSRSAVTSAVNAVFDAVMTVESCGIDYAEDRLNSGVAERDNPCSGAYFTLLRGKREDEGRYVAAKIKEILGSGMLVADDRDKTLRPVRPGDVAILLRSKQQNHVRPYADALTAAGVPFAAPDSSASFAVPSVRKMISVLRAIDNPMKDIDLAAAMISGVFGFNESELVRIRKAKSGVLYYAVKAAADAGNKKAADFIVKLEHYRRRAAALTAEKLIWYIYKTTGLLAFVSSMKGGKREKEALLRFCDSARAYGASGRQDLSGFVAYINRLIEEDVKTAGGSSYGTGNEVRIMTIHQSKGLEFPVCFVCDTASEFNERELDNPFIIEPDRIGMKIARPLEHKRLETAARSLAAKSARGKSRMEEMRVLYVAMTRAAERLEVVASVKDPDKLRESSELRLDAGGRMDAYSIRSAKSFLDWVAPVAFCADGAFNVSVEPEYETPESSPEGRDVPETDGVLADKIYERINSSYGHSASAAIPTKLTVSDIVAAKAGREEGDRCCERRPACLDPSGRGGTEAGTATHAFLQFADFSKLDDPEAELRRLVDMRFITEKQAELIDRRKIANFASSDIFRRIRASEKVTREFRFTFEAVASDYIESAPDEKLLVQGAIDCYFVEGGKCVIVDYKTDRIRNDLDEKAAYYRPQLEIYARGLKELTGLEVSEAVLYFLDADKEVRVI